MIKKNKNVAVLPMLAGLTLVSCSKKEDDVDAQPVNSGILFQLAHFVGSEELQKNTIKYTNAAGNLYSVETLKYFISDIRLYRADGVFIRVNEAFYVDAMDETTWKLPKVEVPTGDYTSITFVFGLDEKMNVTGAFPNPPENAMEWPIPMGGGYHYMKLEGKIDSAGTIKNYQCHTGPTGGNLNYITVGLENSGFTLDSDTRTIILKMNINNWWVSPNTLDLNDMTMIMGNQAMQEKLQANGKEGVFSILSIE